MIDYLKLNNDLEKTQIFKVGKFKGKDSIVFEVILAFFEFCLALLLILMSIKTSVLLGLVIIFIPRIHCFIMNSLTEKIYLEKTLKKAKQYNIENIDEFNQNIIKIFSLIEYRTIKDQEEFVNKVLNIFYLSKKEISDSNDELINEILEKLKEK